MPVNRGLEVIDTSLFKHPPAGYRAASV